MATQMDGTVYCMLTDGSSAPPARRAWADLRFALLRHRRMWTDTESNHGNRNRCGKTAVVHVHQRLPRFHQL